MCFRNGGVTVLLYCVEFLGNLNLPPPAALSHPQMSRVHLADKSRLCCKCSVCGAHQVQRRQRALGGPPEAGGRRGLAIWENRHRAPRAEGASEPRF